tara:strand:- start:924 stop:2180 length:1257 start_codon:yes stop_codon:yes gene_type:complete
MISYKLAKKILVKSNIKIKKETIDCLKSLNRICSKDVYSPVNYPAGNNTAFDGYAINSKDTCSLNKRNPKKFKILKTLAAGDNPKIKKVKKFEAIEVMTGALINKPFDTVIPVEQIKFYPNFKNKKYIVVNKKINKNEYIRHLGSDYKKNELVVKKGTLIKSSHILAFKSLGIKRIDVKIKPNILFFSTGNEISKKKKIANWQIRNSNSHYIKSLSNSFLFNFIDGGILRDQDEDLFKKLIDKNIRSKADIIITSGAVSAGKFDFVPKIIKKFKISNFFKDVAIRPGKPILFAKFKNKEKVFFGLPGNPISSAACFRFFVYPYLSTILEISEEKSFKARLNKKFTKKKKFTRFLKGKLTSTSNGNLKVEILQGQESFRIKPFVKSNVWGVFKAGQSVFKKGQLIECHLPIASNKNLFY